MPEISLYAIFLAGLLGGAHCVGMCGGIVAAMSFQAGARQPFLHHLAYSAGRIASYTAAGALAGLAGSAVFLSDELRPLQIGLYVLAQGVLILLGLYLAGLNHAVLRLEGVGGGLWRRVQPLLARVMPVNTPGRALAAGGLWGWLPCGLVYSVLVAALGSGGPVQGALLLAVFGLGTLPNLLLMGWAAESLRELTRHPVFRRIAGLIVAGLGVWGMVQLTNASW
ncbi:MAG: sulfite exporter TauE/SafE family protein [Betaproteobacteria bacterium]|nr:sulfite exporter TauE/SafE family protein [Betaproteobacteria bacterium]